MEYYTLSWRWLLTLSTLIQGLLAAELTGNDVTETLGGEAVIACSYTLAADESRLLATIKFEGGDDIVVFSTPGTFWGTEISDEFKNRANYSDTGNTNGGTFSLIIRNTLCADLKAFQCVLKVTTSSVILQDKIITVTLSLGAYPEKPSLVYTPTYLKNPTEVTFTCSGGLGRPKSNLKWKEYRAVSGIWADIISDINDSSSSQDCLFEGTSQMTKTLTKLDNNNIVRCYVQNGFLPADNMDYYNETAPLSIAYPVESISVSTTPNSNNQLSFDEGTLKVTLSCSAEGNPFPRFTWLYAKGSTSPFIELGSGKDYSLENLHINHTGEYKCFAENQVDGVFHNISTVININIAPTTTPKPTTTPGTTTVNTEGVTGEWKPKDDDSQTTTIIAVVVSLAVIIIVIVIIVICCMRKKRQNKESRIEEPPLKPRNNQDLNLKNKQDYYGKPDLVTTDSLKKPYNKDYNTNDDALNYADMKFDDKPRSRRPVQIIEPPDYSEIAMPRV